MLTNKKCSDDSCDALLHHNNRSGYCRGCYDANRTRLKRGTPEWDAHKKYRDSYYEKNRKVRIEYQKVYKYGLSRETWYKMLKEQFYACFLCDRRVDELQDSSLYIDHDHACCPDPKKTCGKCVRKLLCRECNFGLGFLKDNPALLRKAADYLDRHSETA